MQRKTASSLLRRLSASNHCSTSSDILLALDCLGWGQSNCKTSLASHAGRQSPCEDLRSCPVGSLASKVPTLIDQDRDQGAGNSKASACTQRCFSSSGVTQSDVFTYHGPLSKALKNLKRLSISGAAASVFGTPILVINTAEAMPPAAQASICFTIASFGIFTTSLLHWFTSPYVHHLDFDRQSREGTATTMNILSQTQRHHFRESEVIYPDTMRPQVTFEVKGKYFYLDANAFEDKDLLGCLSPADPNAPERVSMPEAESKQ